MTPFPVKWARRGRGVIISHHVVILYCNACHRPQYTALLQGKPAWAVEDNVPLPYGHVIWYTTVKILRSAFRMWFRDIICRYSVLKCLKSTRSLLVILSCVLTLFQMFLIMVNHDKSLNLLGVTLHLMWSPIAIFGHKEAGKWDKT